MVIEDSFRLPASFDSVMELFSDVPRLASFLPGCSDVVSLSDTKYTAKMVTQVKFMTLKFDVEGEMTGLSIAENAAGEERDDDRRDCRKGQIEAQMTGKPTALAGLFRTVLSVNVTPAGPEETNVSYNMQASLTGRLASIGELMMKSSIQKNADEFTKNVIDHFAGVANQ